MKSAVQPDRSPFDDLAAWLGAPPRRPFVVGGLLLVAVGLGFVMVRRAAKGSSDYPMGIQFSRELVLQGENVYETHGSGGTHTKYPPFFFLFVAPVATLPFLVGAAVWYLLTLALTALAAWWTVAALRPLGVGPPDLGTVLLPLALTVTLVVTNLTIGQVNLVVLAFVCLALWLASRGRALCAGLALGLSVALKITPGLLVVGFLFKRAWVLVAGAAAAFLVCWIVIPALAFGPERAAHVTESWWSVLTGFVEEGAAAESVEGTPIGYRQTNQSLDAAVRRLVTRVPALRAKPPGEDLYVNVLDLDPRSATVGWVVRGFDLLVLLGLLWIVRGRAGGTGRLALGLEVSLVLIAMVVVSPISWDTHFVVLLVPYAAALEVVRRRPAGDALRRGLTRAVLLSFVLVAAGVSPYARAFSSILLGSLVLGAALARARVVLRREARAAARA